MTSDRRRNHHLAHKGGVACGLTCTEATLTTTDPSRVTCGRCQRTIHMADAEARTAVQRRRREAP